MLDGCGQLVTLHLPSIRKRNLLFFISDQVIEICFPSTNFTELLNSVWILKTKHYDLFVNSLPLMVTFLCLQSIIKVLTRNEGIWKYNLWLLMSVFIINSIKLLNTKHANAESETPYWNDIESVCQWTLLNHREHNREKTQLKNEWNLKLILWSASILLSQMLCALTLDTATSLARAPSRTDGWGGRRPFEVDSFHATLIGIVLKN